MQPFKAGSLSALGAHSVSGGAGSPLQARASPEPPEPPESPELARRAGKTGSLSQVQVVG